ncbi:CD1375 family protein [Brevibacillus sp. NSP2.1]|nr:CD1375 family protein [Brevibacillus sp. NSP2.1]
MAVIYATLIVKGYKTICDVPKTIRNDVRTTLIQLDAPHLAETPCADEVA